METLQLEPEKPVGDTAFIASLLAFLIGVIGWIIGYVITRGQSSYEQKFGSLLARTYLGSLVYSFVIVLVSLSLAGFVAYQDRGEFKSLMNDCKTVPASTEAHNSVVINTTDRTCELTNQGEDKLFDLFAKYIWFALPFIIYSFYFFYVSIRFIIAGARKELYRPITALGGKDLLT